MKKIVSIMLVLALVLALCACSALENTQPVPTPFPTEPPAPTPDTTEYQKKLIEDSFETWREEDAYNSWFHTVTDLDHNGRLEVITASLQGTGMYTYFNVWEVNEQLTALEKCTMDVQEGELLPDIIVNNPVPCYFDAVNGRYYYVFDDIVRIGMAENWNVRDALSLYNGRVEFTEIATKKEVWADDTNSLVRYFDTENNEITAEDYSKAESKRFEGMERTEASFEWVEDEIPREPNLIFTDALDDYGFFRWRCDKTAYYDLAPVNSDGVTWQCYILESEFNDAERFIPQAYPCVLEGSGGLNVREGQWLYIYCSANPWTQQQAPERCGFSWNINPDREYSANGNVPVNTTPSGAAPVITKHPSGESLTVGGKTWFIARAENSVRTEWQFINLQDRSICSVEQTMNQNPGLSLEVLDETTIAVSNVPASFDGWAVRAVFYGAGGASAETEPAAIAVRDFSKAYTSVLDEYREAAIQGSAYPGFSDYTSIDRVLTGGCNLDPAGVGVLTRMMGGIGYYMKDLNKDGIPELLIGSSQAGEGYKGVIIDMFTLQNGMPRRVLASSERCVYMLGTDNSISMRGSSGANDCLDMLLRFTAGGMQVADGAAMYGEPGGTDNLYYYVADSDMNYSNDTPISEFEYYAKLSTIHANDFEFALSPF